MQFLNLFSFSFIYIDPDMILGVKFAVAAEQALQQRAKMSYSATTVQEMAHATKIASKRLRTALGAVRLAKTANDAMILPQQGRRSGYYPDENETESVP